MKVEKGFQNNTLRTQANTTAHFLKTNFKKLQR